jgi:hypothetical protein
VDLAPAYPLEAQWGQCALGPIRTCDGKRSEKPSFVPRSISKICYLVNPLAWELGALFPSAAIAIIAAPVAIPRSREGCFMESKTKRRTLNATAHEIQRPSEPPISRGIRSRTHETSG